MNSLDDDDDDDDVDDLDLQYNPGILAFCVKTHVSSTFPIFRLSVKLLQ